MENRIEIAAKEIVKMALKGDRLDNLLLDAGDEYLDWLEDTDDIDREELWDEIGGLINEIVEKL